MVRTIWAFAWLRVRMLVNSLERTGSRDALERFSLAIEKLGPIMAAVLMVPSMLALSIIGVAAGYAVAQGNPVAMLFEVGRYVLLGTMILAIVGPMFLPASDTANPVRLLLLPISRTTMYFAQSATALGDPWIILSLPLLLFIPVGLLAGGAVSASIAVAASGLLFVAIVTGLTALVTSALHLVLRDRRRGELLALLFIVVLPAVSLLPGLLDGQRQSRRERPSASHTRESDLPAWMISGARRAGSVLPSELYAAAARAASTDGPESAGVPLAGLGATAAAIHLLGFLVFGRVLQSPGSTGARRTGGAGGWNGPFFGLSPGASAVALAHFRLGIRSPRGRATMLSPMIMLGVFAALMLRSGSAQFGSFRFDNGLVLSCFASVMALLAILPISVNQFAVDGAGLTLLMLSPVTEREYLDGKTVGNALIVAPGLLLALVVPMVAIPGGSLTLWAALVFSVVAVYLTVSPIAAMLSAIFPRAVDLNSIGNRSNAHGLAGLLGMLSLAAALAPCVSLFFLGRNVFHNSSLAAPLLLAWVGVALVLNRLLFASARRLFTARRENLAIVAGQKP